MIALSGSGFQVLLVEDDPFMRSAVAVFLQEEMGMEVHAVGSYGEARRRFVEIADICRLALVDVSLPEEEGEEVRRSWGLKLIHEIKERNQNCGVVLWSAYTHFLPKLMQLISEGYRGLAYIPKGGRVQVLQTAIRRVMEGDVFLHRAVVGQHQGDFEQSILSELDPEIAALVIQVADRLSDLSPRQMQVVERMTRTPAAIAKELNLEVRTIRNYQDAIYDRLGLRESLGGFQQIRRDPIIVLALLIYRMKYPVGRTGEP